MTDYTKLIERLREIVGVQGFPTDDLVEAAEAIEALQEENALLEGTLESRGRNIAALQAENERLKSSLFTANRNNIRLVTAHLEQEEKTLAERDALQAKLDAMGKGEPVAHRAWFDADNGARWLFTLWTEEERLDVEWEPLYAAPKALAPEKGTELFDAWCDKSYADGMLLGWNLCESNHPETFQQLRSTRTEAALKVILANRAAHGIGGTP